MPALAASNPRIRRLRRLSGRRSARLDERAFLLEGPVLVAEAIGRSDAVEGLYVDAGADGVDALVDLAGHRGVPVHQVADGVLAGITDVVTPRPVLAVVALPSFRLDAVIADAVAAARPIVVLAEVRDPGNVGTIIRAVDAAGVAGVICTTGTADPWSPKVTRSSAGSVLHVPVLSGVELAEVLEVLRREGVPVLVTSGHRGTPYDETPLDGAVAFVLGNEAHGLPGDALDAGDRQVTIPMEGRAESLNVAVAASVLVFEAARQRRGRSDWTATPPGDKVNTSWTR